MKRKPIFSSLNSTAPFRPRLAWPLLAAVCAVVAVTGLVAAYLPALRAAAIEPMQALRVD